MEQKYVLFQMWEPFRQSLITGHLFYVEQAQKRLLTQFSDMEKEADKASEEWLEKYSQYFNPDFHDEGSFQEHARDVGIEFYQLLSDMRKTTGLSIVAGIYHEWDKQVRQWIHDQICHWHQGPEVLNEVWRVDVGKLFDLMESLGWKIRDQNFFQKLNACRLVVNVYKHGNGASFEQLKSIYPEYIIDPLEGAIDRSFERELGIEYLTYEHLCVSEEQLQDFSNAIVKFWKDVPENIMDQDCKMPDWFDKALKRDAKTQF